ncbi:hypothetical protein FRC03_001909 [Tulasnella sp. 419]|nr:hypothetical protein FRC03_001909 [Tulasnella sp. 419]
MSRGIGRKDLRVGDHFIVVDAGGGTIDISSFKNISTIPLEFEESSIPECCLEGSAFVTQAFKEYVQAKLKGSSFGHPAMIQRIVDHFDQYVKRNFEDPNEDMPLMFGRDEDNDPNFGIKAGRIIVSGQRTASFYENACEAIATSVKRKVVRGSKTTVVLVGGFTGSTYMFKQVRRRLEEPNIQVLRPNEAGAKASATGMLCFYLDRSVKARMAMWTYGISCVHNFNSNDPKHDGRRVRLQTNPVTGQRFLEGGFFVTLKKGTVVRETELTRFPFWHSQSERKVTILNLALECYRGDVLDIEFRDEDSEDQFHELCWFKATIPETFLVRTAKKKRAWPRSTEYYYVSNFHIVVSFGATEFKCYIEWKDQTGKTQRGPITPVWNDDPLPLHSQTSLPTTFFPKHYSSSTLNVKEASHRTETNQAKSTLIQEQSQLGAQYVTMDTLQTIPHADGYLQQDRESPLRLPQPQKLSGALTQSVITPLNNDESSLMESSDAPDGLDLGGEPGDTDLASVGSPLPWERGIKDFQFLKSQSVCTPDLIGVSGDWAVSASSAVLIFTLLSRVILYDTVRKKSREIHYGFRIKSTSSVAHSLSPHGNTLVRWMFNEGNQGCTLLAVDVRTKGQFAQLPRSYQFQHRDILDARWIDKCTIYIPLSAEGIIIRWVLWGTVSQNGLGNSPARPGDITVIQPSESITRHRILKLDVTKDGAWWTASGITLSNPPSGHIQAHHVETDESSFLKGMVSCIAVVDVYDMERALLVSAGVTADFHLELHVEQLDSHDFGRPFITVHVEVDLIEEKDYPRDIIVMHPFPIVAVITEKSYSYFCELNTGAYLYSQRQSPYQFCPGQFDTRGLLIWSHEKQDVRLLTINEGDLIGYCRKVLKNDMLASTIAIRANLTGAEDVVLDEMYGR